MPVLSLRSTTWAPGTMDPEGSFTVTVTVPVSSCADDVATNITKAKIDTVKTLKLLFMGRPLSEVIFRRECITPAKADQCNAAHVTPSHAAGTPGDRRARIPW